MPRFCGVLLGHAYSCPFGKGVVMAIIKPWHSNKPTKVYHNNSKCDLGNNIDPENIEKGPGKGLILCPRCKKLNEQQRKKKRKRK